MTTATWTTTSARPDHPDAVTLLWEYDDLVEARALYARHGYVEIPAYNAGRYAEHWFEELLPSRVDDGEPARYIKN